MPYSNRQIKVLMNLIEESESWFAVIPLINFSIIEFQFADRVLRQFGIHQHIPNIPCQHYFLHEFGRRGYVDTNWLAKHYSYIDL